MLVLMPLYAGAIVTKWRKTINVTLLPYEVYIISFQNFNFLEKCILCPYGQELFLNKERIRQVVLVSNNTLPYYERVIKQYFNLFNFLIGQLHQAHHVLFKAIIEHFQTIHDLDMLMHFHLVHKVP